MRWIILLFAILLSVSLLISPISAVQINNGDGTISISKGDSMELFGPNQGNSTSAWIWIFGYGSTTDVYGKQINVVKDEYRARLSDSKNLSAGKYFVEIQFSGKNTIQDIIYDPVKKQFTSPWRYITPISIPDGPIERQNQLFGLCRANIKYCDDLFFNTTMIVENPFIKFSEMHQAQGEKDISKNGLLYLGGTTNIDPTNTITVTLDDEQIVKGTIEQRYPNGYYIWYAYLDISKLRVGDHRILIKSNKVADMQNILTIGQYIPTPRPTPTPIRFVSNEFVSVTMVETPSATPTPRVIDLPKQFVPVVTESTPIPQSAPSGAIFIAPTKTNVVEYLPPEATPTQKKIPVEIVYIIIGVIASIVLIHNNKE
jgi:hypothetical protein